MNGVSLTDGREFVSDGPFGDLVSMIIDVSVSTNAVRVSFSEEMTSEFDGELVTWTGSNILTVTRIDDTTVRVVEQRVLQALLSGGFRSTIQQDISGNLSR